MGTRGRPPWSGALVGATPCVCPPAGGHGGPALHPRVYQSDVDRFRRIVGYLHMNKEYTSEKFEKLCDDIQKLEENYEVLQAFLLKFHSNLKRLEMFLEYQMPKK
jgi:hypothetical protein